MSPCSHIYLRINPVLSFISLSTGLVVARTIVVNSTSPIDSVLLLVTRIAKLYFLRLNNHDHQATLTVSDTGSSVPVDSRVEQDLRRLAVGAAAPITVNIVLSGAISSDFALTSAMRTWSLGKERNVCTSLFAA